MQKNTNYVLTMPCVCCRFVFSFELVNQRLSAKVIQDCTEPVGSKDSSTGNTLSHLELSVSINAQNTGCTQRPQHSQEPLTGAGVKLAATTTAASLRGSHSLPLHQVLHLAIQGDPPGQDLVLFPAGQAPRCPEITADGGLKVGQLTVWVHAVNYVCGGEPVVEGAQHVFSRGVWVHVARRERGNLWIRGLQGSPWPPTFSFYGWS